MTKPAGRWDGRVLPAAAFAVAMLPGPVRAHAFGQRYDLPVPLWLYLTGAGLVVALSFALMLLFLRRGQGPRGFPAVDLMATAAGRALAHPGTLATVRLVGVVLYLLILATGLLGVQSPIRNLAPTAVWVLWWVGMVFVSALLGDLWAVLNPWRTIFAWLEAAWGRLAPGRRFGLGLALPAWVGAWPAVALLLLHSWNELISHQSDVPGPLARMILGYSALTWAGMFLFGRESWLRQGEVFTVLFSLYARFAPTEGRLEAGRRRFRLRPPAVGLLTDRPLPAAMIAFVLVVLAGVSMDGFRETPAWGAALDWIAAEPLLRPGLLALRGAGVDLMAALETLLLLAFPLAFAAAYLGFARLMAWVAGGTVPTGAVCGLFVLSLVPIAVAYHLAHYLTFLLLAGQLAIPLASDPFGWGWDLFGSAAYAMDVSVVNARKVWFVAVGSIVAGHVFAVYLAHVMAVRTWSDARAARRSQYPILVLMVGYTMTSLWILSQPVVN